MSALWARATAARAGEDSSGGRPWCRRVAFMAPRTRASAAPWSSGSGPPGAATAPGSSAPALTSRSASTSGPLSPRPSTSTTQLPGASKVSSALKRRAPDIDRSRAVPSGAVTKRRGSAIPVTSSPSRTALAPTATARGKGRSGARRGEASSTSQAVPPR